MKSKLDITADNTIDMKVPLITIVLLSLLLVDSTEAQVTWNERITLKPFAIFNDMISESTIEIDARETATNTITLKFTSWEVYGSEIKFFAEGYSNPGLTFQMFDDGTNGDEIADDKIFTLSGIKTDLPVNNVKGFLDFNFDLYIDGSIEPVYWPNFIVVVEEDFSLKRIDTNTIYSEYAVFNYYSNTQERQYEDKLLQTFYEYFPDSYDFILLYREKVPFSKAHYLKVKNDIKGIGVDIFDKTNIYGSSGRLQGILGFGAIRETQVTANLNRTVIHEIGHRWGAFYNDPLLPLSNVHWHDYTTINGVMNWGGAFKYNGDSTFTRSCWSDYRFAPIELYTMGAISKEQLDESELYMLKDPRIKYDELNNQIQCDSIFIPEEFVKITSDSIVKVYGEREPNSYNAQKHFKTATLIVNERQPTREEICAWNKVIRHYGDPMDNSIPGEYIAEWSGVPSFATYCYGLLTMSFLIYDSLVPQVPILAFPENEMSDLNDTLDFNWNSAEGATSYELQISTNPDFSSLIVDQDYIIDTAYAVANLLEGTTYYWHVSALNENGSSEYSSVWEFSTADTSTTTINDKRECENNTLKCKIYPNPTKANITIETNNFGQYTFEITSLNGQLIFNRETEGPTHQIDLSSFQKGVYFITIRSKDFVTTRKIIKL